MRKLAIALVALFTLSMVMVSCDNNNDPNPPENGRNEIQITCTCGNKFRLFPGATENEAAYTVGDQHDYKVYASGEGGGGRLYLAQDKYPFVTYKESVKNKAYFFWRCECGRYHKVIVYNLTHTEIPSGQQPDKWNQFNYLWE